jgi:hypothetical protein
MELFIEKEGFIYPEFLEILDKMMETYCPPHLFKELQEDDRKRCL